MNNGVERLEIYKGWHHKIYSLFVFSLISTIWFFTLLHVFWVMCLNKNIRN